MIEVFAGIGGASLAAEMCWGEVGHVMVEIDPFCQQTLKKNFPNAQIYGNIKQFHYKGDPVDLVWGSPPCQAASSAGKRKGTADDRWLWPDYFRVLRESKARWCVAENVQGLLSLNGGADFEALCASMEAEGYEVRTFLIPASAVGAPHRRNRIWLIGHRIGDSRRELREQGCGEGMETHMPERTPCPEADKRGDSATDTHPAGSGLERGAGEIRQGGCEGLTGGDSNASDPHGLRPQVEGAELEAGGNRPDDKDAPDTRDTGLQGGELTGTPCEGEGTPRPASERPGYGWKPDGFPQWDGIDWKRVVAETCSRVHSLDDGLSKKLVRFPDGTSCSEARWRKESLKMCGNSIVPQIALELFKAIRESDKI